MTTLLLIVHIVVCFALVLIVLLQGGKGADIGATFGAGSSQTVFGATGGQSFMGKLTTGAAVIFMLTSLLLAYYYAKPGADSIMPESIGQAVSQTEKSTAEPVVVPNAEEATPPEKTK
ncbi:preprotein translocase subunit SecG [Syntrophotalea acetylenivorans]|uniref:Protein-export membrane protein SecG n=1 Tax=Syntrophotalea acetylenivorans TaxID=1842532 RepID=A0A1L3GLK7_9BACT|nr:preprotein translocase subunit SecG [Syntrophotalea acetylenivorans]APG26827.1 preprotein translocase subunit SecG [Syntrophotalea acetylenivorans]